MRAELVAVGTEILLGQIVDTHSAYLSSELSKLGIGVYYHTSVGDNWDRLKEVVKLAASRSDVVIFSGGLGPTEDDLTKEVVAEVLGFELVEHSPSRKFMEDMFTERGLSVPPSNYKQALVFPGGRVFSNPNGTAPGVAVTHAGTTFILLPGPPTELYPMFTNEARPFLEEISPGEIVVSNVLRFYGIGESHLVAQMESLIREQTNPTIAPLAKEGEVTLRLTAKAQDEEEARRLIAPVKEKIIAIAGRFLYAEDDDTLEVALVKGLREKKKTVAFVESCTGGLLTEMVTSVPGASAVLQGGVVAYSAATKHKLADVPNPLIEEHGTISMETSLAMAEGIRKRLDTDYALSTTGVAGPDSVEGKPIGLVYIGIAERGKPPRSFRLDLGGSRQKIQIRAAKHALFTLLERSKKGEATQ
ncbi:competence/damage-inducible protein A [Marininema halotolerans]|uniref:Putative competence-damage inducible protein n=1 Tax=Marininema halotolerans TaxID=1155944 RepID=A0A1I6R5Z6_9BACL|nr:competence/damage-inducible protein A [Marininema halotolerans]SFS60127.1 nicotinamide-nucleotide amidase [Marininema halotolerans]